MVFTWRLHSSSELTSVVINYSIESFFRNLKKKLLFKASTNLGAALKAFQLNCQCFQKPHCGRTSSLELDPSWLQDLSEHRNPWHLYQCPSVKTMTSQDPEARRMQLALLTLRKHKFFTTNVSKRLNITQSRRGRWWCRHTEAGVGRQLRIRSTRIDPCGSEAGNAFVHYAKAGARGRTDRQRGGVRRRRMEGAEPFFVRPTPHWVSQRSPEDCDIVRIVQQRKKSAQRTRARPKLNWVL